MKGNFRIICCTPEASFCFLMMQAFVFHHFYGELRKKTCCISNNDQNKEIQDIKKQKKIQEIQLNILYYSCYTTKSKLK